ncbi:MAG: 2-oxoglutarate dehydrogenase complex dihydrolipoyllysine-residue succinyltransferase [Pseudobdellovibrionaceae bacterium]|nr:2-oxoglutarate dehydrogenase complex dihydrolipoyllysine-residue succinyltransferase [Bdellovibrionales bacterium]USN47975.1 MAG: 2-oxoglutarate dehydrogenase complex dihydrolipoyllysine-residue succinyltransferase [Pseudobdellovibrionaceae bacterium]
MAFSIKIPAVGESITEATIAEWSKQDGEYVNRDDVLLVLETDKASVEVVAEESGLLKISTPEGETVPIGEVVGQIDTSAAKPAGGTPRASATPPPPPAGTNGSGNGAHPDLKASGSPAVQRMAAETGINPQTVTGTGRGGRVTKGDMLTAASAPAGASVSAPTAPAPSKIPPLPMAQNLGGGTEEIVREPMSRLRQTIAKRLVEAQQSAAILTTFNEIDMGPIMDLRNRYKDAFKEKYGVGLGFMGFFVKAVVEALKEYPRVNGYIDGKDIVFHNYYHIGIAVGTEKGLVVPVIRHADRLSVAEIEQSIKHYALKARDGKLTVDDLSGGTFTISNGGVYGSLMSTPILNPPQSGILGMHKIEERPVAVKGQVEVHPMMYVALSYDHRIIDGKESVSFLVRVKECIEDPSRIFLGI